VAGGGLSPVCLTSFSVVIVVVPPGVVIFVSCLVDAVFEHPVNAIDARPTIKIAAIMRFIFNTFSLNTCGPVRQLQQEVGPEPHSIRFCCFVSRPHSQIPSLPDRCREAGLVSAQW